MNQKSFQSFIDQHGVDTSNWPDSPEGKKAQRLLAEAEWARQVLDQNRKMFRLLNVAMSVRYPADLEARILRGISESSERTWLHFLTQWLLKPALVALPLVMGFALGMTATDSSIFVENEITATQFDDHSDLLAISDE
ncbi:MAG: hypothetical protein OXG24_09810 [Gammaproteobacteria bacterium]|nr:hypothetical protein [Gammaproteobacteria bacterium]